MEYSDWYERNEDRLKEEYVDYLANRKTGDYIYEAVFFWDWKPEQILKDAERARKAFEMYCECTFDEEVENARDNALEDEADRRADR